MADLSSRPSPPVSPALFSFQTVALWDLRNLSHALHKFEGHRDGMGNASSVSPLVMVFPLVRIHGDDLYDKDLLKVGHFSLALLEPMDIFSETRCVPNLSRALSLSFVCKGVVLSG